MPWLTGDEPEEGRFYCRLTRIPYSLGFLQAVGGALGELTQVRNWEQFGTMTPEQSAEAATELFYEWSRSDYCMVGAIMPYATKTPPPNALPCDGSEYERVLYPILYANLEETYIVDGDHFRTPDLRGRFALGSSGTFAAGTTGGAYEHTLTEQQLAPHIHSTLPHTHTEIGAVPTLINGGIEAPASAASPASSVTGPAEVTVNSAGGGEPFPTIPPYLSLNYCIVAK